MEPGAPERIESTRLPSLLGSEKKREADRIRHIHDFDELSTAIAVRYRAGGSHHRTVPPPRQA
jgi:hypothetical protein